MNYGFDYEYNSNSEDDGKTQKDKNRISSSAQFQNIVAESAEGDILILLVYRQGKNFDIEITVSEHKQSALPEPEKENGYNRIC